MVAGSWPDKLLLESVRWAFYTPALCIVMSLWKRNWPVNIWLTSRILRRLLMTSVAICLISGIVWVHLNPTSSANKFNELSSAAIADFLGAVFFVWQWPRIKEYLKPAWAKP